jgi:hypothetical protein
LVVGSTIQPDYHRNLAGSQHQLVDHEYDHHMCQYPAANDHQIISSWASKPHITAKNIELLPISVCMKDQERHASCEEETNSFNSSLAQSVHISVSH